MFRVVKIPTMSMLHVYVHVYNVRGSDLWNKVYSVYRTSEYTYTPCLSEVSAGICILLHECYIRRRRITMVIPN